MSKKAEQSFIVIGGGIGGLATALGIAETKQKVKVLEQAQEFGEVGAGIQLAANATNVLQRLGVMDKINEIAVFPKRLVLMDAISGEELSAQPWDVYKERYGAPYIVLHSSESHHILVEACEENPYIELVTDQSIVKTVESEGTVTVTAANGDQHTGKAVVGADGIWSKVRKLFSDDEAVCSQYVAYRGAIPIDDITSHGNLDDVYMWIGPNLHLVQYPVRRGELFIIKWSFSKALNIVQKLKKQINGERQKKWIKFLLGRVKQFKRVFPIFNVNADGQCMIAIQSAIGQKGA